MSNSSKSLYQSNSFLRNREQELYSSDRAMQERLLTIKNMTDQRSADCARARQELHKELTQIRSCEYEIAELSDTLLSLKLKEQTLKENVAANKCYETYLGAVVESSGGEFETVDEIFTRFRTLKAAEVELLHSQQSASMEIETTKKELSDYAVETNTQLTHLNAKIAQLTAQQQELMANLDRFSNRMKNAKAREVSEQRELGEICRAVEGILNRIMTQRPVIQYHLEVGTAVDQSIDSVLGQLQALSCYATDFRDIGNACRRERSTMARTEQKLITSGKSTLPQPEFFRPQPKKGSKPGGSTGLSRASSMASDR